MFVFRNFVSILNTLQWTVVRECVNSVLESQAAGEAVRSSDATSSSH